MRQKKIHHLVVTSANGKVAGIVTVSDLLELLARKPEHRSNREVLKARHQEEWTEAEA